MITNTGYALYKLMFVRKHIRFFCNALFHQASRFTLSMTFVKTQKRFCKSNSRYLHAFHALDWRNGWIFRVRKIGFSYWGLGGYIGSMKALYCKNGESA